MIDAPAFEHGVDALGVDAVGVVDDVDARARALRIAVRDGQCARTQLAVVVRHLDDGPDLVAASGSRRRARARSRGRAPRRS